MESTAMQSLLSLPPYSLAASEKSRLFLPLLRELENRHYQACPPYRKMIDAIYSHSRERAFLDQFPYLPVNVFKELTLASIPEHDYFKVLLSSGTTGSRPSQIILDTATAHRQTLALAAIMHSFLGPKRLPMLIIDSPGTLADRSRFSARAAGIVGMSHFGRAHHYALNDAMELELEKLRSWLQVHGGQPFFIFGFTYIVWKHLVQQTHQGELDLSQGILFHSGGWKKLEEEKVDNNTFKGVLNKQFGLSRCHSFYGMVEQVGSVYVECEHGHLHCPNFADVIMRDARSWQPATIGSTGIAQVVSLLSTSYPGHSLLTEDLGAILGEDNCPCGRKGKYFWIAGRVPHAAPRGCGDTFAMRHSQEDSHVP